MWSKVGIPVGAVVLTLGGTWLFNLGPGVLFFGLTFAYLWFKYGGKAVHQVQQIVGRVRVTEVKEVEPPLGPPPSPRKVEAPTPPEILEVEGKLILPPLDSREETELLLPPPPAPPPPIIAGIHFKPGMDFVLGFDKGGKAVTMPEMTSLGIGGVQGVGKTVSTSSIATQFVVKYGGEARLLVIDPHMLTNSDNSLAKRMEPLTPFLLSSGLSDMPNPVSGGQELLNWLNWLEGQVKGRLKGTPWSEKWLIVVDEFVGLLEDEGEEVVEKVNKLLEYINSHARKADVFAVVTSPQWKSTKLGGTDLRGSIASFLLHQMPAAIARQMVPVEVANLAPSLRVGEAILYSKGNSALGTVPWIKPADMKRAVQPYIPEPTVMEPLMPRPEKETFVTPLTGLSGEPTFEEVMALYCTYKALLDLGHSEESAARAISIDYYGTYNEERIEKILALGEKYGV